MKNNVIAFCSIAAGIIILAVRDFAIVQNKKHEQPPIHGVPDSTLYYNSSSGTWRFMLNGEWITLNMPYTDRMDTVTLKNIKPFLPGATEKNKIPFSKSTFSAEPQTGDIWCSPPCTDLYVKTDSSTNHYVLQDYVREIHYKSAKIYKSQIP